MTLSTFLQISLVALFIFYVLKKYTLSVTKTTSETIEDEAPQATFLPHEVMFAKIKPEEAGRLQVILIELNSTFQCMNTSYSVPDKEYWFKKYNHKQIEHSMEIELLARNYFPEVFEVDGMVLNPYSVTINVLSCVIFLNPNEKPLSFR